MEFESRANCGFQNLEARLGWKCWLGQSRDSMEWRGGGCRHNLRCVFFSQGVSEDEVFREQRTGRPGLTGVVRAADAHGICFKHRSSLRPFPLEAVRLVPPLTEVKATVLWRVAHCPGGRQHPSRPAAPRSWNQKAHRLDSHACHSLLESI